ncbi:DNA polymerase epsilon subunit D [[Candida] railenensis]|uniref:DNA polymerase epsilon subunit D n=1 Tax=[Candida] railenensis TaxID=45579 RepID=A0A9P0QN91_9ASCO|nr:DNA polymerase epsilon subunit D [[Candida] railenensis]
MPPKGWRKNAEGQYPSQKQDSDLVSIDDILFPRATVQKLAKAILNSTEDESESNSIMAKDSVIALQRSATVFVSHLMFHARKISKESSRKTVNAQDILAAIERAEFPGFLPEIKSKLATFEQNSLLKRNEKKSKKVSEKKEEDEASGGEQSSKRLKGNGANAQVKRDPEDEQDEDDDEDEEDVDNDETDPIPADDDADDEEDEDEDEDEAIRTQNPITLLEREEKELNQEEGVEEEDNAEEDDEEDDE